MWTWSILSCVTLNCFINEKLSFLQLSFKGTIHWKMIRSSRCLRLAFPLLILVVFHVPASSYSNSTRNSREITFTKNFLKLATKDEPKLRSQHPLANAWMINSGIGVIGIFFNSFELFVFYRERHQMINSVNVMIWSVKMLVRMPRQFLYFVFRMDTFYRVLYSFLVQWRCYNLSFDQNLLRKTFLQIQNLLTLNYEHL